MAEDISQGEFDAVLQAVEELLGYRFVDRTMLFRAVCHTSFANERGWLFTEANERLELLGDAVVGLAVTELLYEDFPEYSEGQLTKMRAPLVRGNALAEAAERVGLDRFVLLGRGEEATGGREKRSILAGLFEAAVGALYLDGGFEVARGFVIACLEGMVPELVRLGAWDYKSDLQEHAARRLGSVPLYRVTGEGPDHFKTFHAVVEVGGEEYGPAAGASKKEAEQGAARVALVNMGWIEGEGEVDGG